MNAGSFFHHSLLVALGGGIGAWLRFAAGRLIGLSAFPFATLSVNLAGSLAMGLLAGWLALRAGAHQESIRLFAAVGVLGGFTTFSAFSMDTISLAQRGETALAAGYVLASVLFSLAAFVCAAAVTRSLI